MTQTDIFTPSEAAQKNRQHFTGVIRDWRRTYERQDSFAVVDGPNGIVATAFINKQLWAEHLIGTSGITVAVSTWRFHADDKRFGGDGHYGADFRMLSAQPALVQALVKEKQSVAAQAKTSSTANTSLDDMAKCPPEETDAATRAEAMAAPVAPPPPAPKPSKSPGKSNRHGNRVQSGSTKAAKERRDPCKVSALFQSEADSQLMDRYWERFNAVTENRIGVSTFRGMCILAGVEAVLRRYDL